MRKHEPRAFRDTYILRAIREIIIGDLSLFFSPSPFAMSSHFLLHTKSISNHFLLPFPSSNNPFFPALYKSLQIWSWFTKISHMMALIMMRMLMIDVPQGVRWWFCTGVDTTKPLLGVDRPRDCNRSGIGWNIAGLVLRCRAVHFGGVLRVLDPVTLLLLMKYGICSLFHHFILLAYIL